MRNCKSQKFLTAVKMLGSGLRAWLLISFGRQETAYGNNKFETRKRQKQKSNQQLTADKKTRERSGRETPNLIAKGTGNQMEVGTCWAHHHNANLGLVYLVTFSYLVGSRPCILWAQGHVPYPLYLTPS